MKRYRWAGRQEALCCCQKPTAGESCQVPTRLAVTPKIGFVSAPGGPRAWSEQPSGVSRQAGGLALWAWAPGTSCESLHSPRRCPGLALCRDSHCPRSRMGNVVSFWEAACPGGSCYTTARRSLGHLWGRLWVSRLGELLALGGCRLGRLLGHPECPGRPPQDDVGPRRQPCCRKAVDPGQSEESAPEGPAPLSTGLAYIPSRPRKPAPGSLLCK